VLDFNIPGVQKSASISYAGGATPLVGSNLKVMDVTGGDSPLNDGAGLVITNGVLSFTSGNFTNSAGGVWNFGGGGSVTITGTIAPQTPAGFAPFSGTSGTLMNAQFASASVSNITGKSYLTLGLFFDPPDATLASYFGLPANNYEGFFDVTFNVSSSIPVGSAFTSHFVGSGDTETSPVPAPGFLVLLCSGGTVSLAGYVLRRRKQAAATTSAV
jgi:hypothetical protein